MLGCCDVRQIPPDHSQTAGQDSMSCCVAQSTSQPALIRHQHEPPLYRVLAVDEQDRTRTLRDVRERCLVVHRKATEAQPASGIETTEELGFAPLDDAGTQLLFRFVAAAYERRSLGVASLWPFEFWVGFLPEHTTAVSLLDRLLHHAVVVVTDGESFRMREARARGVAAKRSLEHLRGREFPVVTGGGSHMAIDTTTGAVTQPSARGLHPRST